MCFCIILIKKKKQKHQKQKLICSLKIYLHQNNSIQEVGNAILHLSTTECSNSAM